MPATHSKAIFEKFIPRIGVTPATDLLKDLFADIAACFQIERVGYSRMEPDRSAIQQEVQYYLSTKHCDTTNLPRLCSVDYPGYFAALETPPGVVIAHDVMADLRLREFWDSYFRPLNIVSMLDVPVHRAGQLYGVICHEQVGTLRRWSEDEVAAACSFAHLVALAVETEERQKAQEALRQALDREREVVEMKSNFVSLVSHEFRTPLGVMVSSADILESYLERLSPEQRAGHLQDIRHAAQQMSGLMEEVLLLGKVESGRMVCRRKPIELVEFCRRLVDEQLSVTAHKCPIFIESHAIDGPAECDEILLRHILNNLLSNGGAMSDRSPVPDSDSWWSSAVFICTAAPSPSSAFPTGKPTSPCVSLVLPRPTPPRIPRQFLPPRRHEKNCRHRRSSPNAPEPGLHPSNGGIRTHPRGERETRPRRDPNPRPGFGGLRCHDA